MKHVKHILVKLMFGLIMGLIIGLGNKVLYGTETWWKISLFATCLITLGGWIRIIIDHKKKK